MKIKIIRENINPSFLIDLIELRHCIKAVLDFFQLDDNIEIKLTNDWEIEELNKRFFHVEGPTNVLSFPMEEEDFLGSICVSTDTVIREAFLYNLDIKEYFYEMLIHGILHLMGFEHGNVMFDYTDKLVNHLRQMGCV